MNMVHIFRCTDYCSGRQGESLVPPYIYGEASLALTGCGMLCGSHQAVALPLHRAEHGSTRRVLATGLLRTTTRKIGRARML